MQLSRIFIYPIKAMSGIALNSVNLEERGMHLDRRWMLVNEDNRFISQREVAPLALLKIEIEESHLKVLWQDDSVMIPFDESKYPGQAKVTIWNDEVEALIASESLNSWFSRQLGVPCKLAYQGKNSKRLTSSKYVPSQEVSFADGYPFLMISEESLDLLNQKLKHPVEMSRFRPNLVIKGAYPHVEDDYQYYKIKGVNFKAVKPCARCNVITINQSDATKGTEPLKTLATYRKTGNNITFGHNLLLENQGHSIIKTGDEVECLNKKV